MLSLEPEPTVTSLQCDGCGRPYTQLKLFLHRDRDAYAICFASLHDHDGNEEAWLDVVLGSLGEDEYPDRVTFGCRVGPVPAGKNQPLLSFKAAVPFSDNPLFGQKLTRNEALAHPWLQDFWEVVDYILVTDPTVRSHLYS